MDLPRHEHRRTALLLCVGGCMVTASIAINCRTALSCCTALTCRTALTTQTKEAVTVQIRTGSRGKDEHSSCHYHQQIFRQSMVNNSHSNVSGCRQ